MLLKAVNSWPDPSLCKDTTEFHKTYTEQWAKAKAYAELISFFDNAEERINQTTKLIKQTELKTNYGASK
jgi:hypothetical protein